MNYTSLLIALVASTGSVAASSHDDGLWDDYFVPQISIWNGDTAQCDGPTPPDFSFPFSPGVCEKLVPGFASPLTLSARCSSPWAGAFTSPSNVFSFVFFFTPALLLPPRRSAT